MLSDVLMSCVRAPCFALLMCSTACISGPRTELEDISIKRGGEDSVLTDIEIRSLLSDARVAPIPATEIIRSHPAHEIFLANGVYQRVVGRSIVEGTFDIREGTVCVQGADFDRQCRKILPESDRTYRFVDTTDGSSIIVATSPLK